MVSNKNRFPVAPLDVKEINRTARTEKISGGETFRPMYMQGTIPRTSASSSEKSISGKGTAHEK